MEKSDDCDKGRNAVESYSFALNSLNALRKEREMWLADFLALSLALAKLIDSVEFDANGRVTGIIRTPGNGGLVSRETMRACGEGRLVLSRHAARIAPDKEAALKSAPERRLTSGTAAPSAAALPREET